MNWLIGIVAFKLGILFCVAAQAGYKALLKILPRRFEAMEARAGRIEASVASLEDSVAKISMVVGFKHQQK